MQEIPIKKHVDSPDFSAQPAIRPNVRVSVNTGCFCSLAGLDEHTRRLVLESFRPGKSTDNAFIEAFNGRLDGRLNGREAGSHEDAQQKTEAWRGNYMRSARKGRSGRRPR